VRSAGRHHRRRHLPGPVRSRGDILDECDELSDAALKIFKDLYNNCRCGFVLVGGQYLKQRILKGVRNTKQSYQEIYSRIGAEFLELKPINPNSIAAVCRANGIEDKEVIASTVAASNGDLRRVKALIETHKNQ
jgi:DNA transposition AAA+ family ATPase